MSTLISLLASSISLGGVLALVSVGFLLLYKATGVLNFAHGDLVTLGAYVAIWVIAEWGLPSVAAYALALIALFLVGVIVERIAYAPLRKRPPLVAVIATLAAAIMIEGLIAVWQGANPKSLASPVQNVIFTIDGARIPAQEVLIVVAAVVVLAAVLFVFEKTSFGRQVRAMAADPEMAQLNGVAMRTLSMLAFGLSAALACLAGVLIAPLNEVTPTFGFTLMISGFAAAVLGGFGSIGGVILGSIVVGLVQNLLGGYVLQGYAEALPFILMFLVLVVRPEGLLVLKSSRL